MKFVTLKHLTTYVALSLSFSLSHAVYAATGDAPSVAPVSADMTDGEIRKIDKDGMKLTIKHGEIKSLDMPPMTMAFRVKDAAMIDALKLGDKIKFKAVSEKGNLIVTELQAVKPPQ
jgi:Cu(I)/Ag(I) efflux system periplasmic protein CusF